MNKERREVVVIGGSIAGLMHGIMVKDLGHNVRILEQYSSSIRPSHAAGMGTGPKGHEFFNTYDRILESCTYDCPGICLLDEDSKTKRLLNTPMHFTSWDALYFRLRSNFDGLISDYCPHSPVPEDNGGKAVFELGKLVTEVSYSTTEGIVTVQFEDLVNGQTRSIQADLVIDASGAHSIIQRQLVGHIEQPYSGYVAWRGLVSENTVSEATRLLFKDRFYVFSTGNSYVVGYAVPNDQGSLKPGERFLNWVWYYTLDEESEAFSRALTDTSGHTHRSTVPVGEMDPKAWSDLKADAATALNPSFLELVNATQQPFLATIRDGASPRGSFFDGHLVLVGEALRLLRPHTGMSANQAAVHCFALRKVLLGQMSMEDWEVEVQQWGQRAALLSKTVGFYNLGPKSSFLVTLIKYLMVLASQRITRLWRLVTGY
ncbi:MAG: hypothetical protein M1828_003689 [Chrysothrix sp. TS-e1954]|nr:MAG: hypothetical protein M1828_003689 [Chrysothrix sp. TS-e1954]